jgi:hypothetical protein
MNQADLYKAALSWPDGSERPQAPKPVDTCVMSSHSPYLYFYVGLKFADGSTYCNFSGRPYPRRSAAVVASANLAREMGLL